jgi:protein tyrosine/serine phosphatase
MERIQPVTRSSKKILLGLGAVSLALVNGFSLLAPPPQNAGPAQKIALDGVPNFGEVSETLFRGGQPKSSAYAQLKQPGIEILVDLQEGKVRKEVKLAEAAGLRFVSIPWSPSHNPSDEAVTQFLQLLRENPDKKILVHCYYG